MNDLSWSIKKFSQLSKDELYSLIKLRIDIFVVEQSCAYAELDDIDRDRDARHVLAHNDSELIAYARLLPPAPGYVGSRIGRFAVRADARRRGLGSDLLKTCIAQATALWPDQGISISAQVYLTGFYQQYGFEPVSAPYVEDGIPHIEMHYTAAPA
nr:putative N-acetyltransferase [uncultured bacterium]